MKEAKDMKEGWEYKKLGEVCDIVNGKNQRAVENPKGIYPIMGSGGIMGYADDYLCKEGTTIIGRKGSINKPIYVNQKIWNVDTAFGLQPKEGTESRFLFYLCKSINFERYNKSVTIPSLVKSDLLKIDIHIPFFSVQKQIASELDLLSGVIEKQKAQLEELDKLAQSIFYDMFGDPLTNEKGWAVIQLGDKCEVTSFKRVLIEEVVEEGIPFIRGTELTALSKMTNSENYEFSLFITPEHYERVKAISGVPSVGDLLIPSINADGNIWILDTSKPRYYKDGRVLWVHVNHDVYTSSALKYIMQVLLKDTYSDMASGATFAELKLFVLREMKIILPPLSLQQEFAAKVEAIEAMKAKVRQSLKEAETLFNSRMDYYFN